eukprot:37505-Pyramimonas_sp.AAC.4
MEHAAIVSQLPNLTLKKYTWAYVRTASASVVQLRAKRGTHAALPARVVLSVPKGTSGSNTRYQKTHRVKEVAGEAPLSP